MKKIILFLFIVLIFFSSCSIDGDPLIEPKTIKGKWERNVMIGSGYNKEAIETISLTKDNSFSLKIKIKETAVYTDTLTGVYEIVDGKKIKMTPLFISGNHYKNMGVHRLNEQLIHSYNKKDNQITINKVEYKKTQ